MELPSIFIFLLLFCLISAQSESEIEIKNKANLSEGKDETIVKSKSDIEFGHLVSARKGEHDVYDLVKKGDYVSINEAEDGFDDLKTFCYTNRNLSISAFWASAQLRLYIENADYQVYLAPNVSGINQMVQVSETAWFYSQLPWRSKVFKIDPFQDICVGVMTSHQYKIGLALKNVDYVMLLATVVGIAIFWFSPKLCRNTFFHYTTGISAGVFLSLLILTYLIQKKMKVNVLGWVGVAYSLSVYFITRTWFNIKEYLTEQYFHWVVGYILLAGILSFMIMYRMGPPENPRTLNLIQWTMQAAGLGVIFMSSYHQPASMLLVILLIVWKGIPDSWKATVRTQYRKTFNKPKVKLLTEDEYNTQAMVETRKALEELRNHCVSPNCSPWKTVSRLNSPKRFAEFIEGSPHVSEEEVMQYSHWDEVSEDEDEDDRPGPFVNGVGNGDTRVTSTVPPSQTWCYTLLIFLVGVSAVGVALAAFLVGIYSNGKLDSTSVKAVLPAVQVDIKECLILIAKKTSEVWDDVAKTVEPYAERGMKNTAKILLESGKIIRKSGEFVEKHFGDWLVFVWNHLPTYAELTSQRLISIIVMIWEEIRLSLEAAWELSKPQFRKLGNVIIDNGQIAWNRLDEAAPVYLDWVSDKAVIAAKVAEDTWKKIKQNI